MESVTAEPQQPTKGMFCYRDQLVAGGAECRISMDRTDLEVRELLKLPRDPAMTQAIAALTNAFGADAITETKNANYVTVRVGADALKGLRASVKTDAGQSYPETFPVLQEQILRLSNEQGLGIAAHSHKRGEGERATTGTRAGGM